MDKIYLVHLTAKKELGGFRIPIGNFDISKNAEERAFITEHFDDLTAYIIPKSKHKEINSFHAKIRKNFNDKAVEYRFGETVLRYMPEDVVTEYEKYLNEQREDFDIVVENILDNYDGWVEDFIINYEKLIKKNKDKENIMKKVRGDIIRKDDMESKFITCFQSKVMPFERGDDTYNSFVAKALTLAYERTVSIDRFMDTRGRLHHRVLTAVLSDAKKIEKYNVANNPKLSEIALELQEINRFEGIGKNIKRITNGIQLKCINLAQELNIVTDVLNLN